MSDYARHYAILRITHDVDRTALRARYKRLIGQWHPDRFPVEGSERELAEEHSKEITIAYQALDRYYRDHGVLPPVERAARTREPNASAVAHVRPAAETGSRTTSQAAARPTHGRRQRVFVALCSIFMASYAAYYYSDDSDSDDSARARRSASADARAQEAAPEIRGANDIPQSRGISTGSTLGEVYAIQGIPTLTEGDIWHYGKSSIRFEQGKVVSWTQHPDNPLHIARDQPSELHDGVFYVGSSKEEVRSIQGTPVSETETVWDYGTSRVYFDHNRVVRWDASPLQPLRVPH
jgi:DnaJ domain